MLENAGIVFITPILADNSTDINPFKILLDPEKSDIDAETELLGKTYVITSYSIHYTKLYE